jgi:hypothetical protein
MNDNFINLKDQLYLSQIKDYLQQLPLSVEVMEASDLIPLNLLLISDPVHGSSNLMYVPLPEDHFQEIRLMQLYSLIIPSINPEKKEDLFYLINEINAKLPIGSISVNKMAELGFKFIFPVPRFEIPKEHQFIEIFTLYRNSLICFKDIINQFTNGSLSLKQVLAKLEDNEL